MPALTETSLLSCTFFFLFWPLPTIYGILRPGIKSEP